MMKLEEEKISYKKGSKIKIAIKRIMIEFEIKINQMKTTFFFPGGEIEHKN